LAYSFVFYDYATKIGYNFISGKYEKDFHALLTLSFVQNLEIIGSITNRVGDFVQMTDRAAYPVENLRPTPSPARHEAIPAQAAA
jgi:hypothetical protein